MSSGEALWIGEEQVAANVTLAEAVFMVEETLASEAKGEAWAMERTHVAWEGGALHALGAAKAGFAGTKTWARTAGGSTPLFILFDRETGALRAVIEASAMGQLRAAAVSAVATRWLAPPDATELAIIGTGRQALAQVAAVAHVRRLRRVRVFGPDPGRRRSFVENLRAELSREVVEASSLAEAVAGAPIVTLVTRATEPVLPVAALAAGAHVNAIGAITPERSELARDVFPKASRIVVDELPAAKRLSRELREYTAGSDSAWKQVETLADVVGARRGRAHPDGLTVFKGMGSGLGDLAIAVEVFHRVVRAGGGREIPQPERARPRLMPGGID